MDVQILAPTGDWTGEGAVWHAEDQAVYWVDINRFLIHRLDWFDHAVRTWRFDEPVTALGLTSRSDTLVVALSTRVIFWQSANDARVEFCAPEPGAPGVRLNDGRPDPAGNFWVGSMANNVGPQGESFDLASREAGSLFRISPDGTVLNAENMIGIANTLCWSPDNKYFYFGDTLTGTINRYDYDIDTGSIAGKTPFFLNFDRGGPDGSAMDSEGYLWNARYGGSCLVRVAPSGEIDRVVEMPAKNITTCTFGGPTLTTLLVTSAAKGDGESQYGGGLFALDVDVPGLPENKFNLDGGTQSNG